MRDQNLVKALREHAEWAQANEMAEYIKLEDAIREIEQINPVDYGAMWDEMCAQDLITMEGLRKLNTLIDECAHGNEGGNDHG